MAIPSIEPKALLKSNNELQCHCSISTFFLTLYEFQANLFEFQNQKGEII